jgi:hypothetical protein
VLSGQLVDILGYELQQQRQQPSLRLFVISINRQMTAQKDKKTKRFQQRVCMCMMKRDDTNQGRKRGWSTVQ